MTSHARAVYNHKRSLLRLFDTGTVSLDVAKVVVCGNYGIGKTTLIKTLETSRHRRQIFQPKDRPDKPSERTAGIHVSEFQLRHSKRTKTTTPITLRVFDFGGLPAFHVIHTLLVLDWTAAFVVCVDLSKSHEDLKQSLWYWLRFIATRVKQSRETLFASELQDYDAIDKRPRVILVGTKADKCHDSHRLNTEDGSSQRLASCIHNAISTFGPMLNIVTSESLVALNCFRSQDSGFGMLKERLTQHLGAIKQHRLVVPQVVHHVSMAFEQLCMSGGQHVGPMQIEEAFEISRAISEELAVAGDRLSAVFNLCLRYRTHVFPSHKCSHTHAHAFASMSTTRYLSLAPHKYLTCRPPT